MLHGEAYISFWGGFYSWVWPADGCEQYVLDLALQNCVGKFDHGGGSSSRAPTIRSYNQVVNRFEVCSFWMVHVRNLPTIFFFKIRIFRITVQWQSLIGSNIKLPMSSNTQYMW